MSGLAPVVAVVGPSGVGKDSVMSGMLAADPRLVAVRRVITRPSSAGGEDFDGIDEAGFSQMVEDGRFALHWSAHGLRYGIPVEIDRLRASASGVLVNLSRAVLLEAEQRFGDFRVIALTAKRDVLASRLAARGRESAAEIERRLDRAGQGLPPGLRSVHQIDNSGDLADAVAAALQVLQPENA